MPGSTQTIIASMHAMVAELGADLPSISSLTLGATIPMLRPHGDVVLVTGTTGSLGCHLLEALAAAPDVLRVYALNRAARDGAPLRARQRAALVERGIEPGILDSPEVVLLEGDMAKPGWGLPHSMYEELQRSVTHVIHNAWRVDLNAKLEAFRPVLEGVRRLIDFALTSLTHIPPRIVFISSTGVLQRAPRAIPIYEKPVDPAYAVSNGYGESKWVAEQLLYLAAERTPLDPLIVRVGQLTGGPGGAWAANEWYPALVQSVPQLGCFPDDPRPVVFLQFDVAAAAILDFRRASNATHTVHLVHPRPVPWNALGAVVASEYSVPLVPFAEWVARLEHAARELPLDKDARRARIRRMRALQLIPFFQDQVATATDSKWALGWIDLEITEAVKASPTLADPNLRQLGAEDVRRWLAYWRRVGLISDGRLARL